jgi:hypothetical protein
VLSLGEEVEKISLINLGLAIDAALEKSFAGGVEGAVQQSQKGTCLLGQDLASIIIDGAQDSDILELGVNVRHDVYVYGIGGDMQEMIDYGYSMYRITVQIEELEDTNILSI